MLRSSVPSISRVLASALVILLILELFACGEQVVCMFGFSFANDLLDELQVNARVTARSASNVVRTVIAAWVRTPFQHWSGIGREPDVAA